MKLDIKKLGEGRMEVKKKKSVGTFELFTANVENCFYNKDVHCVYSYLRKPFCQ